MEQCHRRHGAPPGARDSLHGSARLAGRRWRADHPLRPRPNRGLSQRRSPRARAPSRAWRGRVFRMARVSSRAVRPSRRPRGPDTAAPLGRALHPTCRFRASPPPIGTRAAAPARETVDKTCDWGYNATDTRVVPAHVPSWVLEGIRLGVTREGSVKATSGLVPRDHRLMLARVATQ
jgi:hypothetical protein